MNDRVTQAIFRAIDEINQQLFKEQKLEKSADTVLFGQSGRLDSLGLVSLIVATEQNIEDEFGITITLVDEKAMSQKHNPFETVGSLTDYISLLLEKGENG